MHKPHVIVESPGRVHLGLLQLSSEYKVKFMGLGFAIAHPAWRLHCWRSTHNELLLDMPDEHSATNLRAAGLTVLERLKHATKPVSLRAIASRSIPIHVGLGSKTSLMCALLAAYCSLSGRDEWISLRSCTERGGTSGIGINVSATGGLVLDAGHTDDSGARVGPSSARRDCPPSRAAAHWTMPPWSILIALVMDTDRICGAREQAVFDAAYPLAKNDVDRVAALVLYEVIPAAVSQDIASFANAVAKLQTVGFKKVEWEHQDGRVRTLAQAALRLGAWCAALSSMGPSIVIMAEDLDRVERGLRALNIPSLRLIRTQLANHGVQIVGAGSRIGM